MSRLPPALLLDRQRVAHDADSEDDDSDELETIDQLFFRTWAEQLFNDPWGTVSMVQQTLVSLVVDPQ